MKPKWNFLSFVTSPFLEFSTGTKQGEWEGIELESRLFFLQPAQPMQDGI